MVLIGGFRVSKEELPYNDVVNYIICEDIKTFNVKVVLGQKSDCTHVYIHEGVEWHDRYEKVRNKVIRFKDFSELEERLKNNGKLESESESISDEPVEEEESIDPVFEGVEPVEGVQEGSEFNNFVGESGDSSIEELDVQVPDSVGGYDAMTQQLRAKEDELASKEAELDARRKELDSVYEMQCADLLQKQEEIDKVVDDANVRIESLNKQVLELSEQLKNSNGCGFGEFSRFLENPNLGLNKKDDFQCDTRVSTFAFSNDSLIRGLEVVSRLIKNGRYLVLDLSGDIFFKRRFNLKGQTSVDFLKRGVVDFNNCSVLGNSIVLQSQVFNDVYLLGVDWLTLIPTLAMEAKGKGLEVLVLTGDVGSFATRYALSCLKAFGGVSVLARGYALSMLRLLNELQYIKFINSVVFFDCVRGDYEVLKKLSLYYKTFGFPDDNIDWNKVFGVF